MKGLILTYLLAYGGALARAVLAARRLCVYTSLFGGAAAAAVRVGRRHERPQPGRRYGGIGGLGVQGFGNWSLREPAFPSQRCAAISRACCCPPRSRATRRSRGIRDRAVQILPSLSRGHHADQARAQSTLSPGPWSLLRGSSASR